MFINQAMFLPITPQIQLEFEAFILTPSTIFVLF